MVDTSQKTIVISKCFVMMTSSYGNIFPVAGPFCGEFTGHRWISLSKAVTRRFVFFDLRLAQTVQQTILRRVIWDAIALIMLSL